MSLFRENTIYIGNLADNVSDTLIWELMLQAGPVASVHLPRDRISLSHQGFGFCEFTSETDAEYAVKIMNQIKLYGKPIRVNKASSDRQSVDVGANLFVGGLDQSVDESMLQDTFSQFGTITQAPKLARDPVTSVSKSYAFISFADFEAADQAIHALHNQYILNKPIQVQYAFKKDGKGERHGTDAERLLAAQAKKNFALPGSVPGLPPGSNGLTSAPGYQGAFAGALAQPTNNALFIVPPPPPTLPPQLIQQHQQYGMAPPPPPSAGFGQYQAPYSTPGYGMPPPPPPQGFYQPPAQAQPTNFANGMPPPNGPPISYPM